MPSRQLIAAALVAACVAGPAWAEPQVIVHAGLWDAYSDKTASDIPLCGIATTGADGRRIAIEQTRGEKGLKLVLSKASWAIPNGSAVDVNIRFDSAPATPNHATGAGNALTVVIGFDTSVPFMRAFRNGSQIQVYFPNGNEPVWTGGLGGSSKAVDGFNQCRSSLPPSEPTQPLTPASTPASTGPTQPFSPPATAPAPGPVNTFTLPPVPQAAGKPSGG